MAFSAMDIGRTGLGFAKYWMDTISHNITNSNTVRGPDEQPFRSRLVVAQSLGRQISPSGSGVAVRGVVEDATEPTRRFEPDHALADEDGYVTLPVVDLAGQMTDLMIANRAYQASLRTVDTGRQAYEAALRLGQR